MNGSILKRELLVLVDELNSAQAESTRFSFSLDNDMFHVPRPMVEHNRTISRGPHSIKDILNNKKTINMSFTKSPINMSLKNNYHPSSRSSVASPIDKKERATKILALIKDTKDPSGVSIKDISSSFTDCSEKTIQRELNNLVLKGQIKKKGAKRCSRYLVG